MFRPAFLKLPLIILALALACPASGSAQDARPLVFLPLTFICDPAAWPGAQSRPIPSGKQVKDLCQPGAKTYVDFGPYPIRLPFVSNIPTPVVRPTTGQLP